MKTIDATSTVVDHADATAPLDEAQLAAAAFLARYSGRTLDAYRHDLRSFFQWATDIGLEVLAATRPHIEMYRAAMEPTRTGCIDDRPATLHGLRLLPIRPHRRPHPRQPCPVRPTPQGSAQ